MRLYITVEYKLPLKLGDMSMKDLELAHKEVFREGPGDFITYILNQENSHLDFEFEEKSSDGEVQDSDEFACERYFYNNLGTESNLCLKYGALCSVLLCKYCK
jgi:hypothetical protein